MHCVDTGELQAVRFEHTDTETISQVNAIIGMFKQLFRGNGRVTLIVSGGHVEDFEIQTRKPNKQSKKPA